MEDEETSSALSSIDKSIYFVGIAGTGMAAVAGYFKARGFGVFGSDQAVYPPVSDMLRSLGIHFFQGFAAKHLIETNPNLVVVGNRISADNPEVEFAAQNRIHYTSFPRLLGEAVLPDKTVLVVAGTHGKTTTTALLAHVLTEIGADPSYIVGGVLVATGLSFRVGTSDLFCIEGDEYGSAFFAEEPKFLHYRPSYLLLNAIEHDHADVYRSVQEIVDQFAKLICLVQDPTHIVANIDCPNVAGLIARHEIDCVTVSPYRRQEGADIVVLDCPPTSDTVELETKSWGHLRLRTSLSGDYNAANIAMVMGTLAAMEEKDTAAIAEGIASFEGVKKRLQRLFSLHEVDCYEDFAHHPTAVRLVLTNLKRMHPQRRLLAVFDLKSASSKRNIFFSAYIESLRLADVVALRRYEVDKRIPVSKRMDVTALVTEIGKQARSFATDAELGQYLLDELRVGDVLVFMSCASYNGLPLVVKEWVENKHHLKQGCI